MEEINHADLTSRDDSRPLAVEGIQWKEVLNTFMESLSPRTREAYGEAFGDFAGFLGSPSSSQAVFYLFGQVTGEANRLILSYRSHLTTRGLSSSSINQKLSAIRSLVRMARALGAVNWSLEIPGLKKEVVRDTKGPGLAGFKALLAVAGNQPSPKRERDIALLSLALSLALRRAEMISLDVADVDLENGLLRVLRKGKRQKVDLQIPSETLTALKAWVTVRGQEGGPFFTNLDHRGRGRLTGQGLYYLLKQLGGQCGVEVRPHGLRHTAITTARQVTGDLYATQVFAGHADPRTTQTYFDDDKKEVAAKVSQAVALKVALA